LTAPYSLDGKPAAGLVDVMLLVDKSITGALEGVPELPLTAFELPVTIVVVVEVGDGELADVL
jgi:hypothetical protein